MDELINELFALNGCTVCVFEVFEDSGKRYNDIKVFEFCILLF